MPGIPEYRRVRQYVLDRIAEHEDPGKRFLSEREISRIMGVSRLTVRYALKELVEDQWLLIRKGKGMFVNPDRCWRRGVIKQKCFRVMIIWQDGKLMTLDGFFVGILEQLCSVFKSLPVEMLNGNFVGGAERIREEIEMYHPDGIIWVRPLDVLYPLIEELREKIPVCIFGREKGKNGFAVSMDYEEAGRIAAEYFCSHGCRKVAFVGGDPAWEIRSPLYKGWNSVFPAGEGPAEPSCNLFQYAKDSVEQLDRLLERNPDGIFVFGCDYFLLDRRMSRKKRGKIRILTDENYSGTYGALHPPDAKLLLIPAEMARTAAQELFRAMSEPEYKQEEIVFHASIRERRKGKI